MKQLSTLFILVYSLAANGLFAQSERRSFNPNLDTCIVWDAGLAFTELAGSSARIFYGNMKVFANDRAALGIHFAGFMRHTGNDYGLDVGSPQISYGEFGFMSSYQFVKRKRLMMGAEVAFGYASANIADRDEIETQAVFYSNDDFSYYYDEEVPKVIARNHYFQYMPSLSIGYRFGKYIGLQVAGGYNFLYGKNRFAHTSDFDGWQARASLLFFIPTGEKLINNGDF